MASLAELGPAEKAKVGRMIRSLLNESARADDLDQELEQMRRILETTTSAKDDTIRNLEVDGQKMLSKLVQAYGLLKIYQDRLTAVENDKEALIRKIGRLEALLTMERPTYAQEAAAHNAPALVPALEDAPPMPPPRIFPELSDLPLAPPPYALPHHIFYDGEPNTSHDPMPEGQELNASSAAAAQGQPAQPAPLQPPSSARPPIHPGPSSTLTAPDHSMDAEDRPPASSSLPQQTGLSTSAVKEAADRALEAVAVTAAADRYGTNLTDLVQDVERMLDRCLRDLQRPLDESQVRSTAPSAFSSPARAAPGHHSTATFSAFNSARKIHPPQQPSAAISSVEDAMFPLTVDRAHSTRSISLAPFDDPFSPLSEGLGPGGRGFGSPNARSDHAFGPRRKMQETDIVALLDELEGH